MITVLLWFLTVTCSCCPYLYFGSPIMCHILVKFRKLNDHLSLKWLFIRFTARAFRKRLSIYVISYFPFSFDGKILDLIVSVPDHCLSFYCSTVLTFYSAFMSSFRFSS